MGEGELVRQSSTKPKKLSTATPHHTTPLAHHTTSHHKQISPPHVHPADAGAEPIDGLAWQVQHTSPGSVMVDQEPLLAD